jgi:hypothetical protein
MKKILLHDSVIIAVDTYIRNYSSYFLGLYTDTGIFSEDQILEYYEKEAKNREMELYNLIKTRFSSEKVLGRTLNNTLFLAWRWKTLFVAWHDDGDIRMLIDLIIR